MEKNENGSCLGKRERSDCDDMEYQFEMMRLKIQKLKEEIELKDKKFEELL